MTQGAMMAFAWTLVSFTIFEKPEVSASQPLFAGGLTAVAVGGGLGGAVYYATEGLRARGGWRKTLANVLSILAYAGFVFGVFLCLLLLMERRPA
jgi:hypothetical protein